MKFTSLIFKTTDSGLYIVKKGQFEKIKLMKWILSIVIYSWPIDIESL